VPEHAKESGGRARVRPYVLLTLAPLFWATNMVIGRGMRDAIPPVAMSFWRWLLAGLILLPLVWRDLGRELPLIRRKWKVLAALGLLSVTLFNTLCYIGLQWTSATNGTLFNSVIPVLIIPLAWLILHERLTAQQAVGVCVSLAGVLIIVGQGDLAALLTLRINDGDVWLLTAMALWAGYTVLLRWRPAELTGLTFLACIIYFGLPGLALIYAYELAAGRSFQPTAAVLLTFLYYGIFPSIVANLCFNAGVQAVGPNRAGIFAHLMPVFGTLLSAVFLSERPQPFHWLGMALVFSGIWLSSTARVTARATARSIR
jgi:drug/metabolite transporter (DMT)-like permease